MNSYQRRKHKRKFMKSFYFDMEALSAKYPAPTFLTGRYRAGVPWWNTDCHTPFFDFSLIRPRGDSIMKVLKERPATPGDFKLDMDFTRLEEMVESLLFR